MLNFPVRIPCFVRILPYYIPPSSAHYLAFRLVSISNRLLVMRRSLPILGTIVSTKYRKGILSILLKKNERLRNNSNFRVQQSINEAFSNFIWRGHEYERISFYLNAVKENNETMNYAICLGFPIWYALI